MAWVDDRLWCHPKLTDISDRAFRVWVNGVTYSTGFGTRGILTPGQQKTIGCDARRRRELVEAGLWDEHPDGIAYHDWDEHNSKRDARREADRERKRALRAAEKEKKSTGTSAGQSAGRSTVAARVEGSEGSEGSEGHRDESVSPLGSKDVASTRDAAPLKGTISQELLTTRLVAAVGGGQPASIKIANALRGHTVTEHDLVATIEACTGPGVNDKLAVALAELTRRRRKKAA